MGSERALCDECGREVMSDDLFDCEFCGVSLCDLCQNVVERVSNEDKVLCGTCFVAYDGEDDHA